jgi:acetyltransferase
MPGAIVPQNEDRKDLDVFFSPRSVAVIGATGKAGHAGRTLLWNLISSPFGGTVYPVNQNKPSVLGIQAYPNIGAVPSQVELAVIVTPADTVPGIVEECSAAGVQGAIVISAGFREAGDHGQALERQILSNAAKNGMRILGPNCLGVMCPPTGLNASLAPKTARAGNVALISESGAICTALLDWSLREHVGFSAFISVGSMLDINWGSLIDYLGDDPHTRSIVIYMESIGDARAFLSAAREVALNKPIIVIKAGRTEQAAKAAASHTGSMTGSDEVLEAAFRRVGVLRVNSLSDVFSMTEVLANQPRPRGPKLAIVTNAGGPGVLATDALLLLGGELASLASSTLDSLNAFLPPHWSHNNPVDVIGDATPERYEKAVEAVAKDPQADGLLVIMTPQGNSDPAGIAERLRPFAKLDGKPILASWMGGEDVARGESILNDAGIPTFAFPDEAVRAFHYMWRYSYNLRGLYETPEQVEEESGIDSVGARELIELVRQTGRTLMTEAESKQLLAKYGIPVIETEIAATLEEAVAAAERLGYPVAVKLNSYTVTHKADSGGVKLNLSSADAVRDAFHSIEQHAGDASFNGVSVQRMHHPASDGQGYELILGSSVDPQFGPVLLFGAGGHLVEVFRDRALSLPPLNTTLARRFMEQTKIFRALKGMPGRPPVDLGELDRLLVLFSRLVAEQRLIREIDVNPLMAASDGIVALDARVILYDAATTAAELPRLAIRPYPMRHAKSHTFSDGVRLLIRPIRPEDEPLLVKFHATLSERSVYLRYFHWMNLELRTGHERLTRICFIDYDRQMALVAERDNEILGIGRLVKLHNTEDAEIAVVVSDHFQRRGLGTVLVRRLIDFAREEKLVRVKASLLYENYPMRKVFERLGFTLRDTPDHESLEAELEL